MLSDTCPVCFGTNPEVYLSPCAHGVCERCLGRLLAHGRNSDISCPICRQGVARYVRHSTGKRYEFVHSMRAQGYSGSYMVATNIAMFFAGVWARGLERP